MVWISKVDQSNVSIDWELTPNLCFPLRFFQNRCHHNMISLTLEVVDVEILRKQEKMKENINLYWECL
ncbi:hypothetical protein BK127_39415 [Paenibacillus sp. FSL H7-0331]|nr:hypothetical protein BK127_39415 [Paenibacillus sp. FSL H7-0331]